MTGCYMLQAALDLRMLTVSSFALMDHEVNYSCQTLAELGFRDLLDRFPEILCQVRISFIFA